MTYRFIII